MKNAETAPVAAAERAFHVKGIRLYRATTRRLDSSAAGMAQNHEIDTFVVGAVVARGTASGFAAGMLLKPPTARMPVVSYTERLGGGGARC